MIYYSLNYRKVTKKNSSGDMVVAYLAYATAQSQEKWSEDKFLSHLESKHNSVYAKSDYRAMIAQIAQGIEDRCADGYKCKMGEFGDFYPSLSAIGVENVEDFSTSSTIRNVHVNWSKGRIFANFDNGPVRPQYQEVLTDCDEQNALQANRAGSDSMVLHTTASKEAAFA